MSCCIGVVTGGGDCPGLNSVIRAVAKAALRRGWKAIGILGGYEGLLSPQQTLPLEGHVLDGLLVRGGTILGTANRGRFSAKVGHGESRRLPVELLDETLEGCRQLGLAGLVSIGGTARCRLPSRCTNTAFRSSASPRRSTSIWRPRP